MPPLGDRTVTLVERRHVDLVRVAGAICSCARRVGDKSSLKPAPPHRDGPGSACV
ncbi:putative leader peptide [Streptomyces sp. NPDC005408]|uniref:putative leader peptide n=1 Tax=Streptomyces sp. NPDC005408 TaxID=3155341 RepID=UPI0033A9D9A7